MSCNMYMAFQLQYITACNTTLLSLEHFLFQHHFRSLQKLKFLCSSRSIRVLSKTRMELFKEVNRSGLVALSPDEGFLAAGTMAGTVDETFSLSGKLEIFRLDLSSDDRELPLVESYRSPHRFSRLSWGKNDSVSKSRGLVAGGLFDGEIHLW